MPEVRTLRQAFVDYKTAVEAVLIILFSPNETAGKTIKEVEKRVQYLAGKKRKLETSFFTLLDQAIVCRYQVEEHMDRLRRSDNATDETPHDALIHLLCWIKTKLDSEAVIVSDEIDDHSKQAQSIPSTITTQLDRMTVSDEQAMTNNIVSDQLKIYCSDESKQALMALAMRSFSTTCS